MAKPKTDRVNGAAQAEQTSAEQPAGDGVADGAQLGDPRALAETSATEAPQGEPGPEDFERHTLGQLKAGKAADMKRRAELERELADVRDREARRDAVFAPRFLQEAAAKKVENPILEINGIKLVPRAKRGGAGGFITFRERAPLDI